MPKTITRQLNVRLTKKTEEALEEVVECTDLTKSDVVRTAIIAFRNMVIGRPPDVLPRKIRK